jgi:hypothetical protein
MRVFVALDIDDAIRARLEQFLDGVRGLRRRQRWVRPESMHVTLVHRRKILRRQGSDQARLWAASGRAASRFHFAHGFFQLPGRRVFSGLALRPAHQLTGALAKLVDDATADPAFRGKTMSSARTLLWRVAAPALLTCAKATAQTRCCSACRRNWRRCGPLEFGTMTAREFFLYQSQPMRGARGTPRLHALIGVAPGVPPALRKIDEYFSHCRFQLSSGINSFGFLLVRIFAARMFV